MTNIIKFPPQALERAAEAQEELDRLAKQFDEEFQELLGTILTVCEEYEGLALFDPIELGIGYASLLCSLGTDPEEFLGFRAIRDLCNEYGVDIEMMDLDALLSEDLTGEDDYEE